MRWLVLSLMFACTPDDPTSTGPSDDPTAEPPDPSAPGPHPVGTARFSITGTEDLPMVVQVWYPASEPGARTVRYDNILDGAAYLDAPAACPTPWPMAAFSHGNAGVRYQSAFLTEHLASHGWVVVAPDHPGNTLLDNPDFETLILRRPRDLADAVDWLLGASANPDSPLAGCAADTGYAAMGHSFGGYTALVAAGASLNLGHDPLGDPRITATVGLAPWDAFGILSEGTAEIDVPALLLTGARDQITPESQVRSLWDPMVVQPRFLGIFPEAGHYSFSPVACRVLSDDGCAPDDLDLEILTARVNEAVLTFLVDGSPVTDAAELEWEAVP